MLMSEMMDVLKELEHTSSTMSKQLILQKAAKDEKFKTMLQYALDPYLTYNILQVPGPAEKGKAKTQWSDITDLLDKAARRQVTGSQLRQQVSELMTGLGPKGRMLFKQILMKDLRCGCGSTLVNKAISNLIPEFGIMLATPLEQQHIAKIKSIGAWHQPKKNGDRMAVFVPARGQGAVEGKSRKGHPMLNYQGILRSLSFALDQSPIWRDGMVFDGEVIVGDFFKTRATKKLAGNEADGAVFHVFDMVPLTHWVRGVSDKFGKRRKMLAEFANTSAFQHFQNLVHVGSTAVDPDDFDMDAADEIRDAYIEGGDEGAIFRLDVPYNFKTRSSLFKHKKMDNIDCMIVSVEEGKGKFAGTAGALVIELPDSEVKQKASIEADDTERARIWKERNRLPGQYCEVAFQDWTKPQSGPPKLQFPVYKGLRKDKS